MMRPEKVKLEDIYVPARFRGTLDLQKLEGLAENMLANGQQTPIQVRRDKSRYVLVTGFHRLEALRALGSDTIEALIVNARLH
jgi:ParB-like chromosome segregation protein Spo0J